MERYGRRRAANQRGRRLIRRGLFICRGVSVLKLLLILACVVAVFTFVMLNFSSKYAKYLNKRYFRRSILRFAETDSVRQTSDGLQVNGARLVFTYKYDLTDFRTMLPTQEDVLLQKNVQKTIASFPGVTVDFYDDERCAKEISKMTDLDGEEMLYYFKREDQGKYKSDICRLYILYELGGIYLDNDILTRFDVRPLIDEKATFVSCISADKENFFQAFLAVSKEHPVIRLAIEYTLEYYRGVRFLDGDWMGTVILRQAWMDWAKDDIGEGRVLREFIDTPMIAHAGGLHTSQIFYETRLEEQFLGIELQDPINGGCCCNFVVVDPLTLKVPFFSRVAGVGPFC